MSPAPDRRLSLAQRALLGLVWGYRSTLKPLLPAACRFQPSCSGYALDAVREHGAWRGAALAVRRLLRCRPGGGGGLDPVPPRRAGGRDACAGCDPTAP
jgi:putative membrane protein insertion efficiency factor